MNEQVQDYKDSHLAFSTGWKDCINKFNFITGTSNNIQPETVLLILLSGFIISFVNLFTSKS
jgi:hypothetical protein